MEINKKDFFWSVVRKCTNCMDLIGCNIGIHAEGRSQGLVQKEVDFTLKSCRILRGVRIWISSFIRVAKKKCASKVQDVKPSIVEFILKSIRITCSIQWRCMFLSKISISKRWFQELLCKPFFCILKALKINKNPSPLRQRLGDIGKLVSNSVINIGVICFFVP
jgi:hypothetical protein